jgi:DNA polymerase-3 subunit gamma/tau
MKRWRVRGVERRESDGTMSDAAQSANPPAESSGYRVLARKYRPASFADLIGQDAMVRTISNAFDAGRIPQAWILTGVRGVGKTTTARILARALNYDLPDGSVKGPTITMPVMGVHDAAIMESRHIDVLEMDAASHNSVEDVRAINDAIRYAPVSARYKVYILDEVHMLSGAAFNALLKTLEEPPPHAKFVFATTEIGKVPVTVLSRCQRFDLRRVDAALLVKHLQGIAAKEKIEAEPAALALIARAAEGSVRDSLSLFDQAISHAAGKVAVEDVRQMLGLADRVRIVDLFEALMKGDAAGAMKELREQYDIGADPAVILTDLAEFTHFVTRVKLVPSVADDVSLSEAERMRGRAFAAQLSIRVLSRAWQMLLRGISEVQGAGRPVDAAEMTLVRIAYAADLPTPDEVIRSLGAEGGPAPARPQGNGGASAAPQQAFAPRYEAPRGSPRASAVASPRIAEEPAMAQAPPPTRAVNSFAELIALAAEKRDVQAKLALQNDVRLVRCEDGQLEIALEASAARGLVHDLQRKISVWTGKRWIVVISKEEGAPTMRAKAGERQAALERSVEDDPLVQAVMQRFPGARIADVRSAADAAPESANDIPPIESEDD